MSDKPAETKPAEETPAAAPATAPATDAKAASEAKPAESKNIFGQATFNFSGVGGASATTAGGFTFNPPTTTAAATTGDEPETVEDGEHTGATFEPVHKLAGEVDINPLQDGEKEVLKLRSKLYRYKADTDTGGEWRERGAGDSHILELDGKFRFVMRREKTGKIIANHFIIPGLELKPHPNSEKMWVWTANDYADDELTVDTLAIRFVTLEAANQFKGEWNKARESMKAVVPESPAKEDA